MSHPQNKIERSLIKILAWTFGILIFLIAGGVIGYKQFHKWQERRLVAQANALVNEDDLKRASLDARRILQINPDSVPGLASWRGFPRKAGSRAAVDWRRRVVDLEPGNAADLIALARAAIRFDDKAAARFRAQAKLPEEAKNTTEYHALAADLAAQKSDKAETRKHLAGSGASRSDEQAKPAASRDAAARIDRFGEPRGRGARHCVQLQADPAVRREATRRLVEDAAATRRAREGGHASRASSKPSPRRHSSIGCCC